MAFTASFLERYQIDRPLGAGGMGEVFLARDRSADRLVAIKTIFASGFKDGQAKNRFIQEAQITGQLSHPAIIRLLDHGDDDGTLFVVFEYVAGGDLAARLKRGPLSARSFFGLALPILDAVVYAHDHGVLHRDIKASNVFLTQTQEPRLADFGLATLVGGTSIKTATGLIMGTPAYMAPELGRGQRATASTDQYALGVLFYEMLAGRLPFWHENPVVLLTAHIQEEPARLSTLRPDVPRLLEEAIHRALAKTPDERWPEVADLRAALEACRSATGPPRQAPAVRSAPVTMAAPVVPAPDEDRPRQAPTVPGTDRGGLTAPRPPQADPGRSSRIVKTSIGTPLSTADSGRKLRWLAGALVTLAIGFFGQRWSARNAAVLPSPAAIPQADAASQLTPAQTLAALRDLGGNPQRGRLTGPHNPIFGAFADHLPGEFDFGARFDRGNQVQLTTAADKAGLTSSVARLQTPQARSVLCRASDLLERPLDGTLKAELFGAVQSLADVEAFAAINGVGAREPVALRCVYDIGQPSALRADDFARRLWRFRTLPSKERDELLGQVFAAPGTRGGRPIGLVNLKELIGQQILESKTEDAANFSASIHEIIGNPLKGAESGLATTSPAGCTGLMCPEFYRVNAVADNGVKLRSSTLKKDLDLQARSESSRNGAWKDALGCLPPGLDDVELVLLFAASPRVRILLELKGLPTLNFRAVPEPPRGPWREATEWTAVAIRLEAERVKDSRATPAALGVRSYPGDYRFKLQRDNDLVNLWTATVLGLVIRPAR